MPSGEEWIERRKHGRYPTPEGTVVGLWPINIVVGTVTDISLTGLGFDYVGKGKSSRGWTQLEVFFNSHGFYWGKVPCKVIFDVPIDAVSKGGYSAGRRRCGVQFGDLTNRHASELGNFVQGCHRREASETEDICTREDLQKGAQDFF